jgi:hypothetical protein
MAAITRDELLRLRRNRPFLPFRVYTKTGRAFDVLDPMNILIGDTIVSLTARSDPKDLYGDYGVDFGYDQLLRIEMLDPSLAFPEVGS